MVKVKKDLTGMRFGRLVVIKQAEDYIDKNGKHYSQWECLCDCDGKTIVSTNRLVSGTTKSCGCLAKEAKSKIGKSKKKYNQYDLKTYDYGVGYTSKGEEFWFDKEYYDLIKNYYWRKDSYGYLMSQIFNSDTKKYSIILLHRLITNCPEGLVPDHINGKDSRFDNRKCNLRLTTTSQNNMNKGLRIDNTSGVTGVNFDKRLQQWRSRICVNKKTIELGYFDKLEDAIKVRKEAEEKYFGEYSYDNSQRMYKTN